MYRDLAWNFKLSKFIDISINQNLLKFQNNFSSSYAGKPFKLKEHLKRFGMKFQVIEINQNCNISEIIEISKQFFNYL